MKYSVTVFALISAGAMTTRTWADCKPIAEALAKTATVPNHTLAVSRSLGKIEAVHTQNAYYATFQGVWKQLPYDDAEQAARKIAAFQGKKADCALRGTEVVDGRPVQHFSATEHLKGGDAVEEYCRSTCVTRVVRPAPCLYNPRRVSLSRPALRKRIDLVQHPLQHSSADVVECPRVLISLTRADQLHAHAFDLAANMVDIRHRLAFGCGRLS